MEHFTAERRISLVSASKGDPPLRIAMITSLFPPSLGGIQSHTLRLAQRLVARGAEVHILTRAVRGQPAFERIKGVRVHRVGLGRASGAIGSAAFVATAVPSLVRLSREVDVIHAHQLLSPTSIALLSAPLIDLPLVLNPHACGAIGDVGLSRATFLRRQRLHAAIRFADAFVAVSNTIRDELLAAGVAPRRIWDIGNGVDTERFTPADEAERRLLREVLTLPSGKLVVYAGRLSAEKGVDVLLRAWPLLLAHLPEARLWILGQGPEEARLRAQASADRLGASVTFAGAIDDPSPVLRAADCAVLPSRTEGMPVALLEAMSCALPVVATRVGGSAEALRDGFTGKLVPPEDPAALALGLAGALRDQAPGCGWGMAARAQVLTHAGLDLVAARFEELYRAVAAHHREQR